MLNTVCIECNLAQNAKYPILLKSIRICLLLVITELFLRIDWCNLWHLKAVCGPTLFVFCKSPVRFFSVFLFLLSSFTNLLSFLQAWLEGICPAGYD